MVPPLCPPRVPYACIVVCCPAPDVPCSRMMLLPSSTPIACLEKKKGWPFLGCQRPTWFQRPPSCLCPFRRQAAAGSRGRDPSNDEPSVRQIWVYHESMVFPAANRGCRTWTECLSSAICNVPPTAPFPLGESRMADGASLSSTRTRSALSLPRQIKTESRTEAARRAKVQLMASIKRRQLLVS